MARGDFGAAVPVLERARAAGLPPGQWQEDLAEALLRQGRGTEVLKLFEGAETLSPGRVRLVAGAFEQMQQPERAFEVFSKYLAGGGELDAEARLQYAGVLRQAKRFAEAEAAYRTVLAGTPASSKALFELAEMQAWQGRYAEALPVLKNLVAAHPGNRAMRLALARVLTWSGDYAGAEQAYRQLLSTP
jgi:tetratricopeptide (TPR) repeat protein